MRFLSLLLAIITLTTTTAHEPVRLSEESQEGRIKAFDNLLQMYGKELNDAKNLEKLLEEMERLAKDKKLVEEHTSYYIATLKRVMEKGTSKVLKQEQDRLNSIITSASYQPDGDVEIQYALSRRNIVGAFIESIADHYLSIIEAEPEELIFENLKKMAIMAAKKEQEGKEDKVTMEAEL